MPHRQEIYNTGYTGIVNYIAGPSTGFPGDDYDDLCFFKNGKYHREDGPALIGLNDGMLLYHIDNLQITLEELWQLNKDTKYAADIMLYLLGNFNLEDELKKIIKQQLTSRI